jgi:hypothetical protein
MSVPPPAAKPTTMRTGRAMPLASPVTGHRLNLGNPAPDEPRHPLTVSRGAGPIITSALTTDRLLQVPIEIRSHVCTSLAAS